MLNKNIYKNKLTTLLKELPRKEWNAFEDFVNSPIFNKKKYKQSNNKIIAFARTVFGVSLLAKRRK